MCKIREIRGGTATREMGDGLNFAYLPGGRREIRKYWSISHVGDGRRLALSGGGRREIASQPQGRREKDEKSEWEMGDGWFYLQKSFWKKITNQGMLNSWAISHTTLNPIASTRKSCIRTIQVTLIKFSMHAPLTSSHTYHLCSIPSYPSLSSNPVDKPRRTD